MFTNTDDFLGRLGALIVGADRLHVLFVTYNNVAGYESGPVDTGKDGLTIQVQNGDLEYSPMTNLVYLIGTALAEIGSQAMDAEAQAAQATLESQLIVEPQDNARLLAVIYAGLSAFDEAVSFARAVRRDHPTAKIVIVTCDCNLRHKQQVLEPILASGEIESVVATFECGGRATMRRILNQVMSDWPVKTPA